MQASVRVVLFGLALTALSPALAGAFTLEQVMSGPFASDLTAAPAGGRVAWVAEVRGIRNVWGVAPPDYRARAAAHRCALQGRLFHEP